MMMLTTMMVMLIMTMVVMKKDTQQTKSPYSSTPSSDPSPENRAWATPETPLPPICWQQQHWRRSPPAIYSLSTWTVAAGQFLLSVYKNGKKTLKENQGGSQEWNYCPLQPYIDTVMHLSFPRQVMNIQLVYIVDRNTKTFPNSCINHKPLMHADKTKTMPFNISKGSLDYQGVYFATEQCIYQVLKSPLSGHRPW